MVSPCSKGLAACSDSSCSTRAYSNPPMCCPSTNRKTKRQPRKDCLLMTQNGGRLTANLPAVFVLHGDGRGAIIRLLRCAVDGYFHLPGHFDFSGIAALVFG